MATYNNIHAKEFVKENSNRDTLTIKLVAYDGDNMITYTGDGEYLNHNDSTWKIKTIVDEEYYDYDECTPLHSVSFSYSIPVDQRTTITQEFTHPHNQEEQLEYQAKRIAWEEDYIEKPIYQRKWKELYDAVDAL